MILRNKIYSLFLSLLLIPIVSLALTTNDVTSYTGDTFESYTLGDLFGQDGGWTADVANVTATIVSTNRTYVGPLPISGNGTASDVSKLLDYEAGSYVLTNQFSSVQTNTYIDMVIKMNPADEVPITLTNDANSKVGIYLNSVSNLVLWHSVTDGAGVMSNKLSTLTNTTVQADEWIRLSIYMDVKSGFENPPQINSNVYEKACYLQVRVNGSIVTNYGGYTTVPILPNTFGAKVPASTDTGSWFLWANHATTAVDRNLEAVCFSGAGQIDNFDVTDVDPFGGAPTMYTVTVVNVSGGWISPTNQQVKTSGSSSDPLTLTASNGYYIAYIDLGGAQLNPATNYTIASITSNMTISASFPMSSGSLSNGVPEEWLQKDLGIYTSNYANVVGDDPDGDTYSIADEFLFSTDPNDSNSTPRIHKIYMSGGTPQIEWVTVYDPNYTLPPFSIQRTDAITNPGSWAHLQNVSRTPGLHTNSANVAVDAGDRYFYRVVATNTP